MTSVTATGKPGGAFNGRVMLAIIAAGILSFVGFLFLSAYGPELKQDKSGRSHALSQSAIGYAGLVALREELGRKPGLIRSAEGLKTTNLVVVAPEQRTLAKDLAKLVDDRNGNPTLIILPKRIAMADIFHRGWVRGRDIIPGDEVAQIVSKVTPISIHQQQVKDPIREFPGGEEPDTVPPVTFGKGTVVQTMTGDKLVPYLYDDQGNIILAGIKGEDDEDGAETVKPVYILSDPDVMNNLGLGTDRMAWSANGILNYLATDKQHLVDFDLTLNGFGSSRSLLKLIFEPPFVALSVCLFVASLMALLFGLMRFGPPMRDRRAVAPGKAALVANTADLLRQAGHERDVAERYANLTRDSAAHDLGLAPHLSADDVLHRLDRVSRTDAPFSALRRKLIFSETLDEMLAAARALYHWRKDKTQ
ncbi:MAG: hypothetical protein RL367_736 [Pseudomonadota bacterium]